VEGEEKLADLCLTMSTTADARGVPPTGSQTVTRGTAGPTSGVFTGPEDHGRTVASPPGKPGWGFKPSYYQAGGVHATGGRNATESSPRPGSGPMMVLNATPSPNMTNETTDKPSNGIVPFARIMRPVLGGAMDDSQINMVLFTMREGRVKIPRLGRRESQRFTMLGLPQFNFYLAKTQKQPVAEEELMSPDDIWYGGVRRPGWSLGGVVITEEGADERTSPHNPRRGSERLLNIAIHGYTTVFNVWSVDVLPVGTKLYFILKKVHVGKSPEYTLRSNGTVSVASPPSDTDTLTERPFQMMPWFSLNNHPPSDEALSYEDEFGTTRWGKVIRFGIVHNHRTTSAVRRIGTNASRSMSIALSRALITVQIDIEDV